MTRPFIHADEQVIAQYIQLFLRFALDIDRFAALGVEAVPSTQAQFGQTINSEIAKFAKLIKDVGIKIE